MPAGSIDFITSTNTLEHVPIDEIREILAECHRILGDRGAMSFQVDYRDHLSYFDHTVSPYNFLRFDARTWLRYNPGLHYQNRLRHRDYLQLYADAGFEIVAEDTTEGTSEDEAMIRNLDLAAPFDGYSVSELAIQGASVVLRKAGSGRR
jgi:predicted SAM-dependent methyltransferase